MRSLLRVSLLLALCGLAFGQTSVPVCDPNHPAPNCTDYFGMPNWANSPLPAGGVTGFTVVAAGSGYVNPIVLITDASGTGASAGPVTVDATGAVTAIVVGSPGAGYIAPQVIVVDVGAGGAIGNPTCGAAPLPACGSGALVTAILGGTFTGGMRKFVDTLPNLSLAVPDTTTFPGSDYYVIALQKYTAKLHIDIPASTLVGYVQLNNGTDAAGQNTVAPAPISYLGPTIIAQKDRPVRVLFINMLPTGPAGNLFIPTDTTYMGAGPPYTQNRATLHLHGGATPWISDGTPHQWTVPVGETGPQRGVSAQMVPDMWFDANGNLIPSCAAQAMCAAPSATNDPGQGKLTFYWTNQQGARLMFYHDHAYGLTRLNVYAGEAAGYLLYDTAEENALSAATVPGTLTSGDLSHLIPLVIQDKTFVPGQAQLGAQDPSWAGNFGANPPAVGPNGDLWFPHVYMPNQNPADPTTASAFGRWDYGPWFFPPQTSLTAANPPTAVTVPCTSAAFPNQTVQCPITPNPSGTPEGFMDTPVLNGKAYPVLHVAPAAYRFKLLAAGNDRSWNLSWFLADSTQNNTEVSMVPAAVPSTGSPLPLCTVVNPVAVQALGIGLVNGLLDANGNPLNGTGLPANCWPNYGPLQGIPASQTMWAADGRKGGAPNPATAGPPWIQIGTEGGLLPAPVVIPATPTAYEQNTRSITITSVGAHGLWLGPAERADVIVDFSKFAGKTLILYNDAPTPAPAIDARLDYFTGDGDQTPIGGAPNTQPGYGPNTRTLMQVVVDAAAPNTVPFSLSKLQAAMPGLFKQTQPPIIVPEPTYPPASGGYSATQAYSGIQDYTLTYYPLGSTTPVVNNNERKAIQELFTTDYGRMNATLGTELPLVNFNTQTTIPLGYIDPPTEIIKQGDTQMWKITHNGVDSHFMHFHLFNVQVINRVGWDGSMRPPDQNELGWKDTVRMNPLEDVLVALQPITPVLPFPIRDSYRLFDVTAPVGTSSQFTNLNPFTNNPQTTPNAVNNFGWEYVWHCHILGHEENDMMRSISFQVPPEAPSNLLSVPAATGLTLSFTDNSASETGFTLQRAADPAFTTGLATFAVPTTGTDTNGQGITFGGRVTYNDVTATAPPYYYRVQATKPDASYWTPAGASITSAWSSTLSVGGAFAGVTPLSLTFGNTAVGASSTAQTVTLSNTGNGPLTISSITIVPNTDFTFSTTCSLAPLTVAPNSTCTISVTFAPTTAGVRQATLTITNNSPNPSLAVSLTGAGGLPTLTITAGTATMKYGAAVPSITPAFSGFVGTDTAAVLSTPPNSPPSCSTTAASTSAVGSYPTVCTGAVDASYNMVYVGGTVTVTQVPLTIWGPVASIPEGVQIPAGFTPSFVGLVAGDTAANLTTQPVCTTTATSTSPIGAYPITCTGAVDANYLISYVAGTLNITKGALTVTAPSPTMIYGAPVPVLTPTYNPVNPVGLTTPPTCSTTATSASAVGTYPVTCSGAVDPNYNISYVGGTLTVTQAPLIITAGNGTMVYGGTPPAITPVYTGFVNNDTSAVLTAPPLCSTTATSTSPAGVYPSTCTGAAAANYTISYVAGTVTVTKAPATVTASNGTMFYGGALPTITPSFAGFVNGDTSAVVTTQPLCSTVATVTSNVGTYPSSCSGALAANYTFTYVNGTVTVNRASLTIIASSPTMVYGTAVPVITASYAGFMNGQDNTVLTTQPTCTTTATSTSNIGTYPSTCSGASAANYTIGYTAGTVTIIPAPPTVTFTGAPAAANYQSSFTVHSSTNAGVLPTIAGTAGVCNAGPVTGNPGNTATTVTMTSGTGTCVLTATWPANGNYAIGTATQSTNASKIAPQTTFNGAPGNAVYNSSFTVTATTNSTATVVITSAGSCTNVGTLVTMTSGTGTCSMTATWPPDNNYLGATRTQSTNATKAASTTTITSVTPSPVLYNQPVTIAVTVTGTTIPTGSVNVHGSGGFNCQFTLAGGSGSCQITFTTAGNKNLTASYAGDTNFNSSTSPGVPLTVTAPVVSLNPTSWNFGNWKAGTTSPAQTFTVTNNGNATLTVPVLTLTGANPANFAIVSTTCTVPLIAGANCVINVTFTPDVKGNSYAANLTLTDNAPNSPQNIPLSGKGN